MPLRPARTTLHFKRRPPSTVAGDGRTWVGAAEIDITPPPGIPKAGHSTWSTLGTGVRTRLKARAFFIRDHRGHSVMILQADLHAGSALLRERVAEALSASTDIPQHAVCLTCTHTHSGPGQLSESNFYNDHTSHKAGFDPVLFDWMAERLIAAARQAHDGRRPGRIAVGRREVWGIGRNRSWIPHRANATVEIPADDEAARFREINPWLHLLRLDARMDDGRYQPLAALSCYSVHGTAVSRREGLYNADLWAYAERDVAWQLQAREPRPWAFIHGACQGTHGDINPAIEPGTAGFPEAKRLGLALAREILALFDSLDGELTDDIDVDAGLRQVDCLNSPAIGTATLAPSAVVGNALVAGAYENYTPVLYHTPFFGPGRRSARSSPRPDQGHKRRIGWGLQRWLLPRQEFPHQLIFQSIRIGQFWWLAAPFEITTEAGRRISRAVEQALGGETLTCVTSLANGYTGYCTTPEEYAHQHYEGGHTLYGPDTLGFIAGHLASLCTAIAADQPRFEGPSEWTLHLKTRRYFPVAASETVQRQFQGPPRRRSPRHDDTPAWCARWEDADPVRMEFDRPLLSIEVQHPDGTWAPCMIDGRPVDDQGFDLAIEWLGKKRGVNVYEARWHRPLGHDDSRYRFRIAPRNGTAALYSAPFGIRS